MKLLKLHVEILVDWNVQKIHKMNLKKRKYKYWENHTF